MIKQTSNSEADKAAAETKPRIILEKDTARYIFHALLLTLVFAWVLLNLHEVLQFLCRVLAVFSPFLMGGEAFGILGMLFSVPVCAVLYSLYLEFIKNAQRQTAARPEAKA